MKGKRPSLKAVAGGLLRAPAMPDTLASVMATAWQETCADLMGRSLLTNAMLPMVEAYIGAVWMARECRKAIAADGPVVRNKDGVLRPNPAASMLAKANESIARLGDDLGISAVSRNRPGIRAAERAEPDDDARGLGL